MLAFIILSASFMAWAGLQVWAIDALPRLVLGTLGALPTDEYGRVDLELCLCTGPFRLSSQLSFTSVPLD